VRQSPRLLIRCERSPVSATFPPYGINVIIVTVLVIVNDSTHVDVLDVDNVKDELDERRAGVADWRRQLASGHAHRAGCHDDVVISR